MTLHQQDTAIMVAKAEIHCHIEGAASPALALRQAEHYSVSLDDIVVEGAYHWRDFTEFLGCYDRVAALFRSREDYALLAETYLASLAEDGAIYSEFFISTDHAARTGLDPMAYIEGLADGIAAARDKYGIEARMIATGLRHEGPSSVMAAARFIVDHPHPLVTGWGMAGDERMHHPRDFAAAFELARGAGLGITVHAGELCGAHSVADAMEWLRPSRIGHGVRAIEDPALVDRIADEGMVLEVCPISNVVLKVFPTIADHPVATLMERGVKVTLNSDDPPHFHTSLAREYAEVAETFGLDDAALLGCTRTALEAAFVDDATRQALLARL